MVSVGVGFVGFVVVVGGVVVGCFVVVIGGVGVIGFVVEAGSTFAAGFVDVVLGVGLGACLYEVLSLRMIL